VLFVLADDKSSPSNKDESSLPGYFLALLFELYWLYRCISLFKNHSIQPHVGDICLTFVLGCDTTRYIKVQRFISGACFGAIESVSDIAHNRDFVLSRLDRLGRFDLTTAVDVRTLHEKFARQTDPISSTIQN
jgi:hypothetical protein